jgi:DNA segregation ATPase FtsK/SpoIIIE, S-DNA-T family
VPSGAMDKIISLQGMPTMICRFVSGVDARPTCYLGPGRHVLGRAFGAQISIDDPLLDPHHLILTLGQDGEIRITHISGVRIAQIDGEPIGGDLGGSAARIPPLGTAILTVGASRLRITSSQDPQMVALWRNSPRSHTGQSDGQSVGQSVGGSGGHGDSVVREPRVRAEPVNTCLVAPTEVTPSVAPAPAHTLIGAGIALCAGVVMAVVLGHMMFAAFALMGAFTAVATWGVGRVRHSRQLRKVTELNLRADRDLLAQMIAVAQEIESDLHLHAPEIAAVGAARHNGTLWSRRPVHGDAMDVTLGLHDTRVPISVESEAKGSLRAEHQRLVEDLADMCAVPQVVALDSPPNEILAVAGPVAAQVMRSIVAQLAVGTGPADLQIVAVSADPSHYAWLEVLPHCTGAIALGGAVIDATDQVVLNRAMTRLDNGDPRRVLVVCDAPELLTFRTGPVRRLLDINRPVTMLIEIAQVECVEAGAKGPRLVPAVCTNVVITDPIDSLGISERTAAAIAGDLMGLTDPEDAAQQAHSLPHRVDLCNVITGGETPEAILAGWISGGTDPAPAGVIGVTADAILEINLVTDGPHGLVAGTTGSGKSELLRSLVVSLALKVSPEHLQFVLIDYKGGSTFDACALLPHTVGLVTDLDEGLAERALVSLNAELHRREKILRSFGAGDLTAYRAQSGAAPLARLVVVIDEFAALAHELPGFLAALVGIAQRGRSLGVHLILATQRPAGVIDDAIRANTDLRVALRLNDLSDARDVVGDDRPVGFPRGVPGRSLMRLGADEAVVFQAASSAEILKSLVHRICEASKIAGHRITHRPWLPSLDEVMESYRADIDHRDDPHQMTVGLIDDPAAQCHHDLTWDRSGGLVVIGALGSGTTSTLLRVIDQLVRSDAAVLHVIDAAGEPALSWVDEAPNCAGVIGVHDRERIERLLQRCSDEIDRRQASGCGRSGFSDWVVAIDGLMSLRRSLDDVAGSMWLATLERVLAEGPAMGVVVIATIESGGGAAASMVNRFAMRWVHHLEDPSEAGMYGVTSAAVPPAIPGRIFIPSVGLAAQVYPSEPSQHPRPFMWNSRHEVRRIGQLAQIVTTSEIDLIPTERAADHGDGTPLELAIGIGYSDLEPAKIEVSHGDHVMILGPARSGRSLAAAQIARAWLHLNRDSVVKVICGRRGASAVVTSEAVGTDVEVIDPSDLPAPAEVSSGLLVIVDDAERVEDPTGALARLIESGQPRILVVAVARPDALRGLYGHWTTAVRRSRTGLMMAAVGDLDGDLLSVVLPRRCPIRPRPGLAWIIDAAGTRLAQIAVST